MDFTITSVDDVSREVNYSINTAGELYEVRAYSKKSGRIARREFDELMEAYKVFENVVSWIVFGMYADKDRMDFIENGTME